MKKLLLSAFAGLLSFAALLPAAAQVNLDFESPNSTPPRGEANVAGEQAAYNDLFGWRAVDRYTGPGSIYISLSPFTANYLAKNASNPVANPQGTPRYGAFQPHNNSNGCVTLWREPGSYQNDQFITQQISVVPSHLYQVSYWVLRRPGAQKKERLALTIHSSAPAYAKVAGSGQPYMLTPEPYASIVSPPISDSQNWTQVTGSFVAAGGASTAYLTVGYDRSQGDYDASLASAGGISVYAVDDISLVDTGCSPAVAAPSFYMSRADGCRKFYGIVMPAIAGATRYTASVNVGGNSYAEGGAEGVVNGSNYVTFNLDTEGSNRTVTAVVTVFGNACAAQTVTFSQELAGPDCPPGPGQLDALPYPNPASESATLPAGAEETTLYNSQGRLVQLPHSAEKIDVRNLPNGLYYLQFRRKGKLVKQQLQVQH